MTTNNRSKLVMALISLVSVLAIGCGNSQKDYVFTGTAPTANTGSVRFLLDRVAPVAAQEADIDIASRSAYIEFFDASGASVGAPAFPTTAPLEGTGARNFEIVVTGVPAAARSYELTIYDGQTPSTAFPIVSFTGDIAIIIGDTVTADLEEATEDDALLSGVLVTPDPVNLSNVTTTAQVTVTATFSTGDVRNVTSLNNEDANTFVTYEFDGDSANVSSTGLVSAKENGNTTITAIVTSFGTTANDSATAVVSGFELP